jgi:hypothetical protein
MMIHALTRTFRQLPHCQPPYTGGHGGMTVAAIPSQASQQLLGSSGPAAPCQEAVVPAKSDADVTFGMCMP